MSLREQKRRRRCRWEIDHTIHRCLSALDNHWTAQRAFSGLVHHVRAFGSMLRPAGLTGRPGWLDAARIVRGLAALSLECRYWRSAPETWLPFTDAPMVQFLSLAAHVFGGHEAPACLVSAWFSEPDAAVLQHRMWFRHLAAGHNLRGLQLPIEVTKPMVRFFLEAPSHLGVNQALAWSRLRASGIEPRAALDRVAPERQARRELPSQQTNSWKPTGLRGYGHTENYAREWHARIWEIREIVDFEDLEIEGSTLHHCVAIYVESYRRGESSMWSLSCTDHRGAARRNLTIEVDLRTRTIVEARGKWNRNPSAPARRIMLAWAKQERLSVGSWV